jgi:nucleoside-triphosphatase
VDGVRGCRLFLTGQPGSGKSTAFLRCVEGLRSSGLAVGGISTPERRGRAGRLGFDVVDLASGRRAVMAGVGLRSAARVGRYGVDVEGFESVALPALEHAVEECDVVGIDEIGRMELYSGAFRRMVETLMLGMKPVVSVLHRAYVDVYGRHGTVYRVTPENRDGLPDVLVAEVLSHLGPSHDNL